jgi:uncharacterized Tic20 family protein
MTQGDPNNPASTPSPAPAVPPVDYSTGGGGYPGAYVGPAPDSDSRTMAMLCHLLAIFTGFIGPLVIWLSKKDTSPFVDDQGKESLNFQLTMLLAHIAAGLMWCIVVGMFITPALVVLNLVFCVLATIEANKGVAYRYPFTLRLIK